MAKERLDILLVKRNLIETREKAKRIIMAGQVFSENERLVKPGVKVDEHISLTIKGQLPYVSRGGFKLEKALNVFDVNIQHKIIVDIGASTGGFSDCALQHGASFVYAIDVGYNQLAWKIRNHPQVAVHERTNFRYVTPEMFTEGKPDFAMMDVSFISIRLLLPTLKSLLQPDSDLITLIKPQFEAKKEQVGKKGIIRDPLIHQSIIDDLVTFAYDKGFTCYNLTYSPITGSGGNIEFLAHFKWSGEKTNMIDKTQFTNVVKEAHDHLKK